MLDDVTDAELFGLLEGGDGGEGVIAVPWPWLLCCVLVPPNESGGDINGNASDWAIGCISPLDRMKQVWSGLAMVSGEIDDLRWCFGHCGIVYFMAAGGLNGL